MAATEGSWDIKTSLHLDTSFDLTGMLSDSGKLSLSDIIAATIGESEAKAANAGADSKNSTALVPDFTENSNSCDSNSQQFYPSEILAKGAVPKPDISELYSDNSNACDAFSMGSTLKDKTHTLGDVNLTLNCPNMKTEGTSDCQEKFTIDEIFFSILEKSRDEKKVFAADQQVVPKLEGKRADDNTESDVKESNHSTASFDSDLEDSITFVDPEDGFPWADNSEQKPNIQPQAKRFRPSDVDSSTCPFPVSFKSENMCSFDINSDNSMPDDLNKSFSTKFVTPVNSRSRSLSEACSRDESSPLGESRFNVSLTSLLGSPLSDSSLSNNPFFSDLKSVLELDCKKMDYPIKLFETLSNKQHQDVYARERNLQAKFSSLQSRYPEEIRKLSSFYRCQSAEVETERFKHLHGENIPVAYRNYLNDYYDDQLHKIMNRVEKSVKVLSEAKQETIPPVNRIYLRSRPLLSRKAVTMMDEWYTRNFEHPYPSQSAVDALAKAGEITTEQVKKWFANKRNRCKNIKPQPEIANIKRKRQYSSRW